MASKDAMMIEAESHLVRLCIEAASQSRDAVESLRRQRRTLERMPSHLAGALLRRLLRRGLLHPSLLDGMGPELIWRELRRAVDGGSFSENYDRV